MKQLKEQGQQGIDPLMRLELRQSAMRAVQQEKLLKELHQQQRTGVELFGQERWQEAAGCFSTALKRAHILGMEQEQAALLSELGKTHRQAALRQAEAGAPPQAVATQRELASQFLRRSIEFHSGMGHVSGACDASLHLAFLHSDAGQVRDCWSAMGDAMRRARELRAHLMRPALLFAADTRDWLYTQGHADMGARQMVSCGEVAAQILLRFAADGRLLHMQERCEADQLLQLAESEARRLGCEASTSVIPRARSQLREQGEEWEAVLREDQPRAICAPHALCAEASSGRRDAADGLRERLYRVRQTPEGVWRERWAVQWLEHTPWALTPGTDGPTAPQWRRWVQLRLANALVWSLLQLELRDDAVAAAEDALGELGQAESDRESEGPPVRPSLWRQQCDCLRVLHICAMTRAHAGDEAHRLQRQYGLHSAPDPMPGQLPLGGFSEDCQPPYPHLCDPTIGRNY
eukprot:TRINITY_DN7292_c0_g2_i4.p1 TRINITY_DN7292_c0_g2~~TRINITY_DN7292_c0_g2_i4.p1  ORF type:complete len:464 (+),score=125.37 TRINITY_DN7292_c0_g2_i4:525-1916(+)